MRTLGRMRSQQPTVFAGRSKMSRTGTRLDMPTEQIVANLKAVIQDICTFKPSTQGPFVQKLVIRSSTSEGLLLNLDGLLPQAEKAEGEKNVEDEEEPAEDEEKRVQEPVST